MIGSPKTFYPFLTGSFLGKFTHFLPGQKWVNMESDTPE
jgi:hypothetical protein